MRRTGLAAALVLALLGALAASAAAKPVVHSALLVQSAGSASLSAANAQDRAQLVLADADPRVLAIADRPSRSTADLTPALYRKLWRGTFSHDPPNAVLVGTDASGTRLRIPLVLRSMRPVDGGTRYAVRMLARSGARSLHGASLLIDNAGVVFNDYEPVINALHFPTTVAVDVAADATIAPGTSMNVQCNPTTLNYRTLTFGPGSSLVLSPAGAVTVNFGATSPQGIPVQTLLNATSTTGPITQELTPQPAGMLLWVLLPTPGASPTVTLQATQATTLQNVTIHCG